MLAKSIGKTAEDAACAYLRAKGLKLVLRNYSQPYGEIDLIMYDKSCLVFIEVRYRRKTTYASSVESVNYSKQKKLIRTAMTYLVRHQLLDKTPCRFDVVAVSGENEQDIVWIRDAFSGRIPVVTDPGWERAELVKPMTSAITIGRYGKV